MLCELNQFIITEGKENRKNGDEFVLEKDGYKLYPVDEIINIKKDYNSDIFGKVIIKEMTWKNNKTTILYKLISLNTVN